MQQNMASCIGLNEKDRKCLAKWMGKDVQVMKLSLLYRYVDQSEMKVSCAHQLHVLYIGFQK